MTGSFPLTDFILKLPTVDRAALMKANPDKLAAKYGIQAEHARAYITLELAR